jgi:pimeloyl-ACP methyl ester carboxylesterase
VRFRGAAVGEQSTLPPGEPASPRHALPLAAGEVGRDTGRVRTVKATAAAVTVALAAGAASVAAGRFASDAALKAPPGRPLPTEPGLTVHATAAGQIALTRDLAALRPGTYGLAGNGTHAVVGPVLDTATHSVDTVVRRLERVTHGTLEPGDKVWLTPNVHTGDPSTALGLRHTDVAVPGELGILPAWFVPGARDTWVITVHGLGATREHPMNIMEFLHRQRFPVLDLAYRGDLGAPRSPDGLSHLGETEWRDADAAIRYAVSHGARQVVLHGWSTGATMALRAAAHSGLRDSISGLVLDSPVLSWATTLRALAAARRTPGALLPLAVRAAQGRTGLEREHTAEAAQLTVPMLIFHGPDDTLAPWEYSRRLANARPNLIALRTVPHAPHGAMWNADPKAYEEALRRFLTPLM